MDEEVKEMLEELDSIHIDPIEFEPMSYEDYDSYIENEIEEIEEDDDDEFNVVEDE